MTMLLLPALNEMIDITTTRVMATRNHPPVVIFMARSNTERRWFGFLVPGALLALAAAAPVSAQEAGANDASAVSAPRTDGYISPEAKAVLDRMAVSWGIRKPATYL